MFRFNRLAVFLALLALAGAGDARNKKGDKLLVQGRQLEDRKDWDAALELYEQALSTDPADAAYQMATRRVRFQAGQAHVDKGLKLRQAGSLAEALIEFQKAYQIDPSSMIAVQEIRRTQQMIQRQEKIEKEGKAGSSDEAGLTPAQLAKKQTDERLATILPIPELKPLKQDRITLKMNNQSPKVLFETLGKVAGINVLFDPEYQPGKPQSIEFNNSTLDEALDYLAVVTKSFWKPLSQNTIFVTMDNPTKRRDYEEQVMKVFYLSNVTTQQELQEIVTAIRSVADIQRLFVYTSQMSIIARGEADKIALAEKIIADLDKPKPEVVVDVLVMESNSVKTRDLTASPFPGGINQAISYTPGGKSTTTTTDGTTTTTTTTTSSTPLTPLNRIGRLSTGDFSVVLPGAQLEAIMSDRGTRVLQSPQVRSVDGQKAQLKIGDRVPTASGSFQPGVAGVGFNPLVNTQFQFIDVGVNLDLLPKVHDNGEISMHVEIDISQVRDHVDLGGISQPVIGQRKVTHDIRMKEGEVNLLTGLMQTQDIKTVSGVPGLSAIPIIRRLFTSESIEHDNSELLIALIPHIIRKTEVTADNLRGIAVGNATVVKLNYAPRKIEGESGAPAVTQPPGPVPAAPPEAPPKATPEAAPPPETPPVTAPPAPAAEVPVPAPPTPAPKPAASVRVSFAPPQVQIPLGGGFTVTLMVQNAEDLFAAPLSIKFDPKVLRLNDVVRGDFLSRDGQQVLFTKNILNDTGDGTVILSRTPNTPGVSGSGSLVMLNFQAAAKGTTTVMIPNFTLRNSKSEPILTATPQLAVTVQ